MKDSGRIIAMLELACIPYRFDGRKLETDGAILVFSDNGTLDYARKRNGRIADVAYKTGGLLNGDARERI